ncbi:hypothetical protein HAX54_005072 [Datura stramonium]|uniref:Uncharacterized protein n=1 Tax=Datura stramonium TaxID=4076 RepID=A0ABS8WX66_DATST|nr:hypothetical protein [Datura stramonium]
MGRLPVPKSSSLVGNWDNVNVIVNLLFPFTVYLPVEDLRFESNGGIDADRKSEDETGERWEAPSLSSRRGSEGLRGEG